MSRKEELSRRAFDALAKGDDAAVEAIRAEIASLQTRYNNDRDSEVTFIVARVIRGEAKWDDVVPQLTALVDEAVEDGSAREVSLRDELAGERTRAARVVSELEGKVTQERERTATRVANMETQLAGEIARRDGIANELRAERLRTAELAAELTGERERTATLSTELAKRAAPEVDAPESPAPETVPGLGARA